jgi:ribosomal protein S18 acetylase RimI-like enzyme
VTVSNGRPAAVPVRRRRRWTIGAAVRRATEVFRNEGVRSLWFRVVGEAFYRRLLLLERPFADPMAVVEPRLPVIFEGLGPGDAADYCGLRPDADPAEIERRLRGGNELCVVGRLDGRVVEACWIAIDRVRVEYLDRELRLADGVAYIHELFIAPELRGKGLDRALYTHMLRVFRDVDVQTLMATSQLETRTYRLFERIGFRRSAVVGYVGIGPLRWYFVHREPGSSLLDPRHPFGERRRRRARS